MVAVFGVITNTPGDDGLPMVFEIITAIDETKISLVGTLFSLWLSCCTIRSPFCIEKGLSISIH